MDSENTILKHKINKLHSFINCETILINDLLDIAYELNSDKKCDMCYKDYLQFCEINNLLNCCSKKTKKNIKESITFLEEKGLIDSKFIMNYKKFKKRFVNGIFDYCHNNTLISYKKLENLLKEKIGNEYKTVFENIKFNYKDFNCCPYYKKPEKVITFDLSHITPINYKNNYNNEETNNNNEEFINDIVIQEQEPLVWEKKITNYKKSNHNIKPNKIMKKPINQELEIEYNKSFIYDILSLKYDYMYAKEKEYLVSEIERLEKFFYSEPYNILLEKKLIELEMKLRNEYNDQYIKNSFKINDNITNLIKKEISIFNQDVINFNEMSFITKKNLIEMIKEIKFNIFYGNEIIEACERVGSKLSINVIDKVKTYKKYEIQLINNFNKIKKGDNNILDI